LLRVVDERGTAAVRPDAVLDREGWGHARGDGGPRR
jgi:hypothetical protein